MRRPGVTVLVLTSAGCLFKAAQDVTEALELRSARREARTDELERTRAEAQDRGLSAYDEHTMEQAVKANPDYRPSDLEEDLRGKARNKVLAGTAAAVAALYYLVPKAERKTIAAGIRHPMNQEKRTQAAATVREQARAGANHVLSSLSPYASKLRDRFPRRNNRTGGS